MSWGQLPPIRSWLYVPGDRPDRIDKAFGLGADAVIIDLEDAVRASEKDAARRNAVAAIDAHATRGGPALFVRVNDIADPGTASEITELVRPGLAGIRFPKCEDPGAVAAACATVATAERAAHLPDGGVAVVCGIETARGLWNAHAIATAAPRVMALGFGAADFARDLSLEPDADGRETLYARSALVVASRVAGIRPPVESVQTDIADVDRLRRTTRAARALGFFGRSVIHPTQIDIVNEAFTPSDAEIARARAVVAAARGGVAAHGALRMVSGEFVDVAIVRRAEDTLRLAELLAGART